MGDVHEVVLPGCPFLRKLSPDIIFPSRPLFIIIITIIIIDHTIIIIIRMIIITQGQSRAKWTAQLATFLINIIITMITIILVIIINTMIIITQGQSRAKWTAQLASVRLDSRAPWEQVQQSSSHRVIM